MAQQSARVDEHVIKLDRLFEVGLEVSDDASHLVHVVEVLVDDALHRVT
jgi:hypothetical protein